MSCRQSEIASHPWRLFFVTFWSPHALKNKTVYEATVATEKLRRVILRTLHRTQIGRLMLKVQSGLLFLPQVIFIARSLLSSYLCVRIHGICNILTGDLLEALGCPVRKLLLLSPLPDALSRSEQKRNFQYCCSLYRSSVMWLLYTSPAARICCKHGGTSEVASQVRLCCSKPYN